MNNTNSDCCVPINTSAAGLCEKLEIARKETINSIEATRQIFERLFGMPSANKPEKEREINCLDNALDWENNALSELLDILNEIRNRL